jgi:hypothetical protein
MLTAQSPTRPPASPSGRGQLSPVGRVQQPTSGLGGCVKRSITPRRGGGPAHERRVGAPPHWAAASRPGAAGSATPAGSCVVDVEGGQQQDVGGAHADKVQPDPAPAPPAPPPTPGGPAEGGGGKRQGAKHQQVGVLGPAQGGQPARGGDRHAQRTVVQASQAGVAAGALWAQRRGGAGGHASLVAREYGIPAVVATGDATTRLVDGQVVTVDGGAGTVRPPQ